jgi:hypothetical protein
MLNNSPQTNQSLSSSRVPINANFVTWIDPAFSANHVPYMDGSGNMGWHKFIQLPAGVPIIGTNTGNPQTAQVALYSKNGPISGVPELFFQRNNLAANMGYSITEGGLTNPGWTRLPCGILVKWQSGVSFGGSNSKTINLNTIGVGPNFATTLTILITPIATSNFDHVIAISNVTFPSFTVSTMNGSSAPSTLTYAYLAIGT